MPNWTFNDMKINTYQATDEEEAKKQLREFLKVSLVHPKITDKDGKVTGEDKEEIAFTFNGAMPMPETLLICSGSSTDIAVACILYEKGIYKHERSDTVTQYMNCPWVEKVVTGKTIAEKREQCYHKLLESVDPEHRKEGKMAIDNVSKYGAKDWYDWCIQNWGTKWDAGDSRINGGSYGGDLDTYIEMLVKDGEVIITFDTAWSPPCEWMQNASKRFPLLCFVNKVTEESNAFVGCPVAFQGELCENMTSIDYPSHNTCKEKQEEERRLVV